MHSKNKQTYLQYQALPTLRTYAVFSNASTTSTNLENEWIQILLLIWYIKHTLRHSKSGLDNVPLTFIICTFESCSPRYSSRLSSSSLLFPVSPLPIESIRKMAFCKITKGKDMANCYMAKICCHCTSLLQKISFCLIKFWLVSSTNFNFF